MMGRCWAAMLNLSRQQVRSLYAIAMLAGIVALSLSGMLTVHTAENAALVNPQWFKLLVEVVRYIFALIAMFALIIALTVFGADYFKAKYGNAEFQAGGKDDEAN